MLPEESDLNAHQAQGILSVSAFSIGWAERREGQSEEYGTCYKYSTLYSSSQEICEEKAEEETSSIFVKPLTLYGLCSATWVVSNEQYTFDLLQGARFNCRLAGSN